MSIKVRLPGWLIALLGLWEFGDVAAVFVPSFGVIPAFLWNHIVVGLLLVITGAWAAATRDVRTARTLSTVALALGAWLVAASFILRLPGPTIGRLNDVAVGALVVVLAVAWRRLLPWRG